MRRFFDASTPTTIVRLRGRSAVLRRAASGYLRRSRSRHIGKAHRRAYEKDAGLGMVARPGVTSRPDRIELL
jgi:hypothetical protein